MDTSKLKNITRGLALFKDYSSLMVPVAIGAVGVLILILAPLLLGSKLQQQIDNESIRLGRDVKFRSKDAPSSRQWQVEQQYQLAHERDANQIALLVKQTTQRPLLSYKIFPKPKKDISVRIFEQFGQQFRSSVDALLTRINARDCPTEAELEKHLSDSSGSHSRTRRSYQNLDEQAALIVDDLCRQKAESASVYANPADLSRYEFWGKQTGIGADRDRYEYAGTEQAVEDCWYSQLAYWIIEDVIDTTAALNAGSKRVFTSPVKRLMTVKFTAGGEQLGRPSYVFSPEDGLAKTPLTGRTSTEEPAYQFQTQESGSEDLPIDVVHFNVSVIVSTKAVLPFMKQLCSAKEHEFRGFLGDEPPPNPPFKHNQITILESRIYPIDQKDPRFEKTHDLYRYGDDAVVRLDLICEYIFIKDGYDKIKPESVNKKPESTRR